MVPTLIDVGLTKEVEFDIGKTFNERNLKNMYLITSVIDLSETMDKKIVASRRIHIADYPLFTKEDPQEDLESYITDHLATGVMPVAYSFEELQDSTPDPYSLKSYKILLLIL